ncbi:hypothetical protein PENSTE_c028G00702 [Penicillium steckii]|uniref:Nephrocystin 3-like N-terminal domain-containing protein n=1 Tax=Penicillium steckii TaxID=303698 RepID=A0A1V6SN37_9EURO|nr:hypothetical protein PENSTE_c028G00702 [Penicillium steckii]
MNNISDSDENDLILVGPQDVGDFNSANILPLPIAELQEIRAWLKPTPYDLERSEYSRHLASHLPGTGKWLTSTSTFKQWRESDDHGLLWIKGIPGSGKSVMAASIIDQLQKEDFPVVYFFFRQIIDANHQPIAALRDWLCQLLNYSPPLQVKLMGYVRDGRRLESMSTNDFWRDLKMGMASLSKVYCVTDALDEMDRGNDEFLHSLAGLGQWRPSNVKVLMTSRPVAIIENSLRSISMPELRLEEHLVDADIVAYVQCRLQGSSIAEHHWEAIKEAIPGRANGLFLYAKLSMDAFIESSSDPDTVLKELPADLNVMYENLLHEHSKRSNVPNDLQLLVLQFVTHATRPLRLLEMAEMVKNLNVLMGEPTLKETKDLVRATCGPLLEILPDETISVVHHSFTEFLKGYTRSEDSDGSTYPVLHHGPTNQRLAIACLNYLDSGCLDDEAELQKGYDSEDRFYMFSNQTRSEMRLKFPFLEYAATNWHTHAGRASDVGLDMSTFHQRVDKIFSENSRIKAWQYMGGFKEKLEKPSLLHIAAWAGLEQYVKCLLQKGEINIESRDAGGNTALYWGAMSGSAKAVLALLDHRAEPDAEQNEGLRALHVAARHNHADVVRHLLTAGVSPFTPKTRETPGRRCGNAPSSVGHTPFMYACTGGHTEAVAEFLPFLKDPNDFQRALSWAAKGGHSKTVRLLLQRSEVDVNSKHSGDTALFKACESGDRNTIMELLQGGADPNIICKSKPGSSRRGGIIMGMPREAISKKLTRGYTALHAICNLSKSEQPDAPDCIKLLIDAGADVHFRAPDGSTALHMACKRNGTLVKALLEAGADPAAETDFGSTILHTDGVTDKDVLPLILGRELLDMNKARPQDGQTPLHCRFTNYTSRPLTLLEYKPDVNAVDSEGNTVLHLATQKLSLSETIDILIAAGADPNVQNHNGDTPLHLTDCLGINKDMVSKLLLAGADIEARNFEGRTPMYAHIARREYTSEGGSPVVQRLIESGARLDTRDFQGRTLLHQCVREKMRLDYLISLGLDPKLTDYQNNSLLFETLENREPLDQIKYLQSLGLDFDQPNNSGRTILHEYCSKSHLSPRMNDKCPLEYILRVCKSPSPRDHNGVQPIHIAATISAEDVVMLLEAGADVFAATNEGMTILHIASRTRQSDIVAFVLSKLHAAGDSFKHMFINKQDASGKSALHYACRSGRPETVKLLLESGAMPDLKDRKMKSPFELTAQFEIEQSLWQGDTYSTFGPGLNAGGFLLNDQKRLWRDRKPNEDWVSSPALDTEHNTARIEEIFELLVKHGAELTTGDLSIIQAFEYAASNGLDYTVDNIVRFAKRIGYESLSGRLESSEDYLVSKFRWEGAKNGIRCGRSFGISAVEGVTPRAKINISYTISEKLLNMRHYDLFLERLSITFDSNETLPPANSPICINKDAQSVLHLLAERGYKDLLAEICTRDMASLFDDPEWCSLQEKEAETYSSAIKPLLMTACNRVLPNMEVVKFLVDKMGVKIDTRKRKIERNYQKRTFETRFDTSVIHQLATGTSWWHVESALPYLIGRGGYIELRDHNGRTPLQIALTRSDISGPFQRHAARVLIENGANVNARDEKGNSCLSLAGTDLEMVKLLLSHGADVDKDDIRSAVMFRQTGIMEALLSHSYNVWVSQLESKGVHLPERRLLEEIDPQMRVFIAAVNQVKDHAEQSDEFKITHCHMVKILLEYGANPYATYIHSSKPKLGLFGNPITVQMDDDGDNHPRTSILHQVLESGGPLEPFFQLPSLDLEYQDGSGCTLLLAASKSRTTHRTRHSDPQGQEDVSQLIIDILLDRGANIAAQDNEGKTVLHHMFYGTGRKDIHGEAVRSVIRRKPDLIHVPDQAGDTPLHYALKFHSFHFINLAVESGADMLLPDSHGNTALHHIAEVIRIDCWKELFQRFLEAGVDINSRNEDGETPLFRYVAKSLLKGLFYGHEEDANPEHEEPYLNLFRQAGADLFAQNKQGSTLLHVLASLANSRRPGGSKTVVGRFKLLMSWGLDPMVEDFRQRTSLDIAAACGNELILKLFKRKPLG